MTEASVRERFRAVARTFSDRVAGVGPDGWEAPSPCAGWVARDVVGHLAGWIPGFLAQGTGRDFPTPPAVTEDPVGAWTVVRDGIQAILDDPTVAETEFDHPMAGTQSLGVAIDRFILSDVLVHTWDLARATGQDETTDAGEATRLYEAMLPIAEVLAGSEHFGARVPSVVLS